MKPIVNVPRGKLYFYDPSGKEKEVFKDPYFSRPHKQPVRLSRFFGDIPDAYMSDNNYIVELRDHKNTLISTWNMWEPSWVTDDFSHAELIGASFHEFLNTLEGE